MVVYDEKSAGGKPFFNWHFRKRGLHTRKPVLFNEREIWWCSVGVNVGHEIDGKGENFLRPVLIIKKTSGENFLGIPMTSKKKDLPGYYEYKEGYMVFEQVRAFNARRLISRKEIVSRNNFATIKDSFIYYLSPRRGSAPSGDLQ